MARKWMHLPLKNKKSAMLNFPIKTIFISGLLFFNLSVDAQHIQLKKQLYLHDSLGWDYLSVDTIGHRIFSSHANQVLVIDGKTDSIIKKIPNTLGVHGISFNHKKHLFYTSNGKANSVYAFDTHSYQLVDTVNVSGINPDAILYDRYSNKLFTFNGKSNDATVIDPETFKVISKIPLPGKPEFAVTDLRGNIYVNIETLNSILHISAKTYQVLHTWKIEPGEEPTGLAIDIKNNLLYSVCSNAKMIVFDIYSGKIKEVLETGLKTDAVVFNPKKQQIYVSNGQGTLQVFQQKSNLSYTLVETIITQKGCKTMTFDSYTNKIYIPAAQLEGDTKRILNSSFEIRVYHLD